MNHSFITTISYNQIVVFDTSLKRPFNDWTKQHVHQGFSMRKWSIWFGTTIDWWSCELNIKINKPYVLNPSSTDAILVPFYTDSWKIGVWWLFDFQIFEIIPWEYELFYEVGMKNSDEMFCNIYFNKKDSTEAKIIKLQPQYTTVYPLLLDADPA